MMRLVNIASWKGMGAPPFYGAPFLLLRTTSRTLRCRRNEVVLLFKSTTSCSPGDSFGTRETGERRHVPPRLTRIGGPASIRARLCVRAESKLLQESRLAANTRSLSRPIVIDQKWRTGPISHVQFGVFVKLS